LLRYQFETKQSTQNRAGIRRLGSSIMLAGHAILLLELDTKTDLTPLLDQDVSALVNWDAEAYRQKAEFKK